jgi:hypothetical protein
MTRYTRKHSNTPFFLPTIAMLVIAFVLACLFGGLGGCTATTPGTTVVPTATINDQTALAYDAVTFSSTTVNALLRSGKMTLAQHKVWQQKLATIYAAIPAATTVAQLVDLTAQAQAVATANGASPPK